MQYALWCHDHVAEHGRVAIFARKTQDTYAAILGTLISGRSYVPLHPEHPQERWQRMLDLAEVGHGIVPDGDREIVQGIKILWCSDPGESRPIEMVAHEAMEAYVMFTSGSTGGPKGVPVGRAQLAAYLQHQLQAFDLRPIDRCTQLFALTFDLSVHDLFMCWASGACLCVPPDDPLLWPKFTRQEEITIWFSVPSVVDLMQRMRALRPLTFPSVRLSFFCGEALSVQQIDPWKSAAPGTRVINLYGPTEATVAITAHEVDVPDRSIPIGRVFPGHKAYIQDENGAMTFTGEGELIVAGPQVNSSYLKDPIATGKAFFSIDGMNAYKTGDRVRMDENGLIHFLGRIDDQVKIQGHRVEPQEIDAVIHHGTGSISCTIAVEQNGLKRLVTFMEDQADEVELFALLQRELPAYMIPDRIVRIEQFPYNAHGKLDRRALASRL